MIHVKVRGIAPLLQHRFNGIEAALNPVKKKTGSTEKQYALEWLDTMYATGDGYLYEPSSHFERSLIKAATAFRVKGAGKKTYKDNFLGGVLIHQQQIPISRDGNRLAAPTAANAVYNDYDAPVYIDVQSVVVNRARVARARLCVNVGWEAEFDIQVLDDQLDAEVVKAILEFAGRQVAVGTFRPKYGRFELVSFTEN